MAALLSIVNNALLGMVWWRAYRRAVSRSHPLFYVFISFQLAFTSCYNIVWAALGSDHTWLVAIYSVGAVASQPLQILVLLECLAMLGGLSLPRLPLIGACGLLFAGPALLTISHDDFYRTAIPVSLTFQIGIWALILGHILRSRISVDAMLGGILAGLILILWLEGLVHLQFSRDLLQVSVYKWVVPLIYSAALLVFWFSFRARQPASSV